METVGDVLWRDFRTFFWILFPSSTQIFDFFEEKNFSEKWARILSLFFENFFFVKFLNNIIVSMKKFKKKSGNHAKIHQQQFSKFKWNFFLFDWSENPKYKNSQKNEKILKKRASLYCFSPTWSGLFSKSVLNYRFT